MANIKDIAEAVGVSPSTVSRVINGKSYVNEETRQKVLSMVEQTGYQPNLLAKGLKMGRSNTLCLVMPSITNLIFPSITRGVEDVARKNGFTVILCNTDEDDDIEKAYIEKMKNRWIDGFVICSYNGKDHNARALRQEGFPVVMVNRYDEKDIDQIDVVSVDNYKAAYTATSYLIKTGHKRIALALGNWDLLLYRERYYGYRKALEDGGIPYDEELVLRGEEEMDNLCFYHKTKLAMSMENPPDAVFATSDPKAFSVMHALHDMKISIPGQVAVLGFDNVQLSSMMEPPLSTVSQPLYDLGAVAAKNLIRQILYKEKEGILPAPIYHMLETDLIIRKSAN